MRNFGNAFGKGNHGPAKMCCIALGLAVVSLGVQAPATAPQASTQTTSDARVKATAKAIGLLVEAVKLDREGAWQKAQQADADLPPGVSLEAVREKARAMRRGPVFIDAPPVRKQLGESGVEALLEATRSAMPHPVRTIRSRTAAVEQASLENSGRRSSRVREDGVYVRLESIQREGDELAINVRASWTYLRSTEHAQTATGSWVVRYLFSQQGDSWTLADERLVMYAQ